jgi:transcriptional regulator with XRE-family HTH domain
LRKARRAAGLDLKQLSLQAGLSHNTAYSIESGVRVPAVATVADIAHVLAVSPAWLGFGETRPRISRSAGAAATLGERLGARREELGLSYRAVARAAGVSDMTVRATEQNQTSPSIDTAERIAKALGVSPGWLAFGTQTMAQSQTISSPSSLER